MTFENKNFGMKITLARVFDAYSPSDEEMHSFKATAQAVLGKLEGLRHKIEEGNTVMTYGQFIEKDKQGKDISIETIQWNTNNPSNGTRLWTLDELILIAKDSNGKVVGTKEIEFSKDIGENTVWEAESYVSVQEEERGKKIGYSLSTTMIKVLQRLANNTNTNVVLEVVNGNLEQLEKLKATDTTNFSDTEKIELKKKIKEKKEEYRRWKTIFGHKQALGIIRGKKVITPNTDRAVPLSPLPQKTFQEILEALKSVS